MKICFVGNVKSAHIIKWCTWFANRGHDVHIVTFESGKIDNVSVHSIDLRVRKDDNEKRKLCFLFQGFRIKKIISTIKPDIINVHYATGYGTAVALSGLNNYILSVWGSDIYDFPRKGFFHKEMVRFSLYRAKFLFSTSKALAAETRKYTSKRIYITPFGVDIDLFSPDKRILTEPQTHLKTAPFIIGTIKGLDAKYGIDYLLKAVSIIKDKRPEIYFQLRIAGKGKLENYYRNLADELGISDRVEWLGYISQEKAAVEWANMDVAVIPSILESESFGVSAVEAQACGIPVIISDIPGLMEATKPDSTSIVVERKNETQLADKIIFLYDNAQIRKQMGCSGRRFVKDTYEVDSCFREVENLFMRFAKL